MQTPLGSDDLYVAQLLSARTFKSLQQLSQNHDFNTGRQLHRDCVNLCAVRRCNGLVNRYGDRQGYWAFYLRAVGDVETLE